MFPQLQTKQSNQLIICRFLNLKYVFFSGNGMKTIESFLAQPSNIIVYRDLKPCRFNENDKIIYLSTKRRQI